MANRFSELQKNIRIFTLFSIFSLKSILNFSLGVFLFTVGKILRFVIFFLMLYYLVEHTNALAGYNVDQAILIYLTFNIVDNITQILFREVYRFQQLVVSGDLDGILIKPYNPFTRVLLGGIDAIDLLLFIPLFAITAFHISRLPEISAAGISLYLLLVFNGLIVATAFHIFILVLGVLTTSIDHAMMIYRDVTSLGRFPIGIYQEPIRWIFTFAIPVGIMSSFPPQGLFGMLNSGTIAISIIISFTLLYLSVISWNKALARYQSWGG